MSQKLIQTLGDNFVKKLIRTIFGEDPENVMVQSGENYAQFVLVTNVFDTPLKTEVYILNCGDEYVVTFHYDYASESGIDKEIKYMNDDIEIASAKTIIDYEEYTFSAKTPEEILDKLIMLLR